MAKKKQTGLPTKWFVVAGIIFVFLIAIFSAWKISPPPQQLKSGAYQLYQNAEYRFSIEYPNTWDVKYDTQVFENGDAVAFRKKGPTQKENTELTDGAQLAISKPFTIATDLTTWKKWYFTRYATFSQLPLNNYTFEVVDDCPSRGCMRYYFTTVNNHIVGAAMFAEDKSKEKAAYENALLHMLKSLRFEISETGTVSKEDAVAKVKTLPEIIDYLQRVPNGLIAVNGEEDNAYLIQAYEFKDGHTATFNWYKVDKITGDVKKEF